MKKVAFALLSPFGFTYQCEQIFSHIKHIFNTHSSKLPMDHSEGCVKRKVSRYSPEILTVTKGKQGQGLHYYGVYEFKIKNKSYFLLQRILNATKMLHICYACAEKYILF